MKKRVLVALACCLCVMALAGCVNVNIQKASSGSASESTESSAETSSASNAASSSAEASDSASAASSASSASSATPASTGNASYDLGNLYFLNVHEGDTGVVADAAVEVVNTGDVPITLGASAIKIYNESGTEIVNATGNAIFTGPSYLRVGDIGFIYTSSPVQMPSGYFPGYDYKLTATTEISPCKEAYEYPITNNAISDDGFGVPTITGVVTNDDTENADLIEITAIFLDNDGQLLGVASDIIVNLAPGASQSFTIIGDLLPVGCTMAMISDYDVIAMGAKY